MSPYPSAKRCSFRNTGAYLEYTSASGKTVRIFRVDVSTGLFPVMEFGRGGVSETYSITKSKFLEILLDETVRQLQLSEVINGQLSLRL